MALSMGHYKRMQPALGTWLELTVQSESCDEAHALMTEAFAYARGLESIFSAFDAQSALTQVNRASPGCARIVAPELEEVLCLGAAIENKSHGAFRLMPRCPHRTPCYTLDDASVIRHSRCQFDLGGVAKGYIVDRVFEWLMGRVGAGSIAVNAGGDFRGAGPQVVQIRVPSMSGERRYALQLDGGALATSCLHGERLAVGTPSARYVGAPERSVRAVTVHASRCAVADALTKVALFGRLDGDTRDAFQVHAVHAFGESGEPMRAVS
jgi:thiamine biosynthesis lipoprotein ApbE